MYSFKPITELKIQIYDPTQGHLTDHIMWQLSHYKKRWNESLATNLQIIYNPADHQPGIPLVLPAHTADQFTIVGKSLLLSSISELTHHDLRSLTLTTCFKYTKDIDEARDLLNSLPDLFTYDCETAKADDIDDIPKVKLALDPYRNQLTMFSFAASESEAFVISNESQEMENLVLDFLTSTDATVVMHNASFDMQIIRQRTGKFIKSIEDTQLMWRCINNHVDTGKALTGLKHLSKNMYPDYAVSKELFGIEHKYNPELIEYSATDAMATMFVFNEAITHQTFDYVPNTPNTDIDSTLLPTKLPKDQRFNRFHFYSKVAMPLVRPTIDLMLEGLHVNFDNVETLKETIDTLVEATHKDIANNKTMTKFRQHMYKEFKKSYIEELNEKKRSIEYYTKPFKPKDMTHRSYLMNYLFITEQLPWKPDHLLPNGVTKWTVNDVKHLLSLTTNHIAQSLLDGTLSPTSIAAQAAIRMLALDQSNLYNQKYQQQINDVSEDLLPQFNPGSSKQLTKLFDFLGIPPLAFSKDTGAPSWGRKQLEEVNRTTTDGDIRDMTSNFIDYSFAAIIKSTFIPAFYKFVTDGKLRGKYNLLGAKTARYTSDSPNMLNAPSSGSKYAKPFKQCITAPEGFIVATADFSQLEDRVLACITNDEGKCGILESKLDSHCYNCYGYYTEEVEAEIGSEGTMIDKIKRFMEVKESNTKLKALRSKSKAPTFKLAYLGNPDADKGGAITQEIYDNYHNVLYSGVKEYIDEYVIPSAKKDGELHLALGWYIKTDNPNKDFRTLHNATCQSWSILTAIAMAKVYQRIQEDNMQNDIQCTATIYDSIYYNVRSDPKVIHWLNTELVKAMSVDFLEDQRIKNEASMEIGPSWANLEELSTTASIEEIETTLAKLKE